MPLPSPKHKSPPPSGEEVEAVYRGQEPMNRDATLKRWRYLATREVVK